MLQLGELAVITYSNQGRTPLIDAVHTRSLLMVQLLLKTGRVAVNQPLRWVVEKDADECRLTPPTPIFIALGLYQHEIAHTLLYSGQVDLSYVLNDSFTPLSLAASNDLDSAMETLIKKIWALTLAYKMPEATQSKTA